MAADDMARDLRAAGWREEKPGHWWGPGSYWPDTLSTAYEWMQELAQQRERDNVKMPVVGTEEM